MSTTLLNKDTVTRKWYVLDAAGKPMGKTAALAADLLRGKLKTTTPPHVDCGDFVIIINAEQAVLTGKARAEVLPHALRLSRRPARDAVQSS